MYEKKKIKKNVKVIIKIKNKKGGKIIKLKKE